MNQAFYQTKLEKRPLTVPVDHVPLTDSPLNFLDFEERCLVSNALQKLSRHNDISTNIKSFFADRAKSSGTVSMHSFKQVLKLLGLEELLTPEEVSVVFKSFSLPAGTGRGLDYKNFLVVLAQIRAM